MVTEALLVGRGTTDVLHICVVVFVHRFDGMALRRDVSRRDVILRLLRLLLSLNLVLFFDEVLDLCWLIKDTLRIELIVVSSAISCGLVALGCGLIVLLLDQRSLRSARLKGSVRCSGLRNRLKFFRV